MSVKHYCDRCRTEIKPWRPHIEHEITIGAVTLTMLAEASTGPSNPSPDLCGGCFRQLVEAVCDKWNLARHPQSLAEPPPTIAARLDELSRANECRVTLSTDPANQDARITLKLDGRLRRVTARTIHTVLAKAEREAGSSSAT